MAQPLPQRVEVRQHWATTRDSVFRGNPGQFQMPVNCMNALPSLLASLSPGSETCVISYMGMRDTTCETQRISQYLAHAESPHGHPTVHVGVWEAEVISMWGLCRYRFACNRVPLKGPAKAGDLHQLTKGSSPSSTRAATWAIMATSLCAFW